MRLLAIVLALLIIVLQWPLWVGKGSWLRAWQLDQQLSEQQSKNEKLKARNDALAAEVRDLKAGTDAIEERARNELGMIRRDEVFMQVLERRASTPASGVTAATVPN